MPATHFRPRRRDACATFRRYAIDALEPRVLLAADLVGTFFNVVPAQVGLNHTVTVNFTVKNQNLVPGLDYADIFFVHFFLSANSSISDSDIFLDTDIVLGLFAGDSHSAAISLDLAGDDGSGPGTGPYTSDPFHNDNQYYIGMIINYKNQITESDYSNNSNEGDGLDRAPISSEKQLPSPTDGTSVVHTALTIGTPVSGDIWHRNDGGGGEYIGPYDVDIFRFTAATNQTIKFDLDVEAFSNSSRLDSYLKLYNSSFIELDHNDNGASPGETLGTDSYFGHTFSAAGTYYIVISDNSSAAAADPRVLAGRSAGGFGAYTLNTQITSAPPSAPDLRASSDTGTSSTDGITRDGTPTFDVTAPGAGTVRLYQTQNNLLIGQATSATSAYAVTAAPGLVDGQYDIFATFTAAGLAESPLSATALHLTIDSAPPSVAAPVLDAASDTSIDPLQKYTSDTTPTLVGSAEAAATAEVLLDGISVAPVTRNGAALSYTPAAALAQGLHSVTTRATDVAGNQATAIAKTFTVDTIRPTTSGAFRFETGPEAAVFTFSESVGAPTSASIDMVNLGTMQVARPDITAFSSGKVYELTFGSLYQDGLYRVTVHPEQFPDLAGNVMTGSTAIDFFAFGADANRDQHVNALDFNALASGYGRAAQTFSQGDFNLDHTVNSLDFAILATRFNKSLPVLLVPLLAGATSPAIGSLFGTRPVFEHASGFDPEENARRSCCKEVELSPSYPN